MQHIENNKYSSENTKPILSLPPDSYREKGGPGRDVIMFLLALTFCCTPALSQNSDTRYNKPVTQTIRKIERIFGIKVEDKKDLLKDKTLDYADWRIRYGNPEISLTNILAPFDLTFFKESDSVYTIRKFEYPRRYPKIGKERLSYLETLYNDRESWEQRRGSLKNCMNSVLWLDKAPPAPGTKPILTEKRIYKGYSVENIGLEILPGVFATGSVYKPYPLKGKHPVIVCPNGHFSEGRYRESQQVRSATLARMGAIVVGYDLFGWGESELQFPGYHWNSIAATVQVLDGMRLLDYLLSLPEADPDRIAVTGGSGGGSHTLFLTALDDRVTVSAPVVMVSSHFSGGCPCESGQPVHLCGDGTNNAEIAAMAAPRPQLIVSDGKDWTRTVADLEYPFVRRIYGFYDKENRVKNAHFPGEGHDYGTSKRMAVYRFMAEHLGLDINKVKNKEGEIDESGCKIEDENTLKVFGNKGEKLPPRALKDIDKLYELFGEKNMKTK
ncbi:acetylxylan esterase [Sinomicrobium kalidii]|uniref:alpha/beta hydrolase family protein n=1 Tax=Sinomicrobium kalidii TaxID=2900738 RepID=UPI001E59B0FE|nr:acetylxylan esterase [Sinomicrobium kalidii]UGU15765.1 acetylxylan esterase [Sinomicrobium kalidii]